MAPKTLLYLPDHAVRAVRITREGDFLVDTEQTPSHIPTRNCLPVRQCYGTTWRVFTTEVPENQIVIPFVTLTLDKQLITQGAS